MTAAPAPAPLPAARSRSRTIALRIVLALPLLLAALIAAAWFARAPLLRSAADLWIVDDALAPADAVAVFGGGLEARPFAAADYYRRGLVKKIVISNIGASPAERLGVLASHVEHNRRVLLRLGVPDSAIEPFGEQLSNTYEEARALRDWVTRTGAHSVIVPTEIFSSRRVRWTLHRVFDDATTIRVAALPPYGYGREDWWKHETGLITFQNEVMKHLYYRVKY
jgi:uncharacterized SAM-binding protein YcdF (DUF218 family)